MSRTTSQRVHFIAGASGVGTSTRAIALRAEWEAQAAARPVCVISTDVVRAELRTVIAEETNPDLWGESFNLAVRDGDDVRSDVSVTAFLRQCAPILRAVSAGVDQALAEGWDVIVEGVHLVPDAFELPDTNTTRASFELIVVDDRDEHLARFDARHEASAGRRPGPHYAANVDRIRTIQAFLHERATIAGRET